MFLNFAVVKEEVFPVGDLDFTTLVDELKVRGSLEQAGRGWGRLPRQNLLPWPCSSQAKP